MHLVGGVVQSRDVGVGEVLGGGVRSDGDRELPPGGERGDLVIEDAARGGGGGVAEGQFVAGGEGPAVVAAELPQRERRGAAEVVGHRHAAADGEVHAHAERSGGTDGELLPGEELDGRPGGDGRPVDGDRDGRARDRDGGGLVDGDGEAAEGALESRCALVVADGEVGEAEGEVVHRAGRRNPDRPVAGAAWPVLHGGHRAGADDGEGGHAAASEISSSTAVGSKPLQGLLICGQLEINTSVSISARSTTFFPGAERPSTMPSVPSGSTGTYM
ncbi:Uncharacterised protein (plasmid) [Tsukamurella tyrosinosolvens]|nr:Uncharacterised protein [Tsukamurella tyrosinosolvens]